MIPLTRVEKEHIFSIFYEEKPNLYLVSKGKKHCFSGECYEINGKTITLNKEFNQFFNTKKTIAFFFHKKVKICFKITFEKSFPQSFNLPEKLYIKEKKESVSSFPILQLFYQNLLLSTFLGVNTKTLKERAHFFSNDELKEVLTLSNNLGHNLPPLLKEIKKTIPYEVNLYSHVSIINDFLLNKKRGKIKRNNLYLFSDSNIILLFSTAKFAKQFSSEKEFLAKISFNNRNIFCDVKYDFFSPFSKEDSQFSQGFLLFKITNIQEEDKRYLYESVYENQYGSF
ncbi:MAG: hypothetical protein ACTTJ6_03870 [Treponema sp.]